MQHFMYSKQNVSLTYCRIFTFQFDLLRIFPYSRDSKTETAARVDGSNSPIQPRHVVRSWNVRHWVHTSALYNIQNFDETIGLVLLLLPEDEIHKLYRRLNTFHTSRHFENSHADTSKCLWFARFCKHARFIFRTIHPVSSASKTTQRFISENRHLCSTLVGYRLYLP